jgi:hypothetical protein
MASLGAVAWRRWGARVGIPGVLAAGAYVLQAQVGEQLPGWLHWTLLIAGGLATVAALFMPTQVMSHQLERSEAEQRLTHAIEESVAGYRVKINDGLRSFVGLLDQIINARPTERRELQGSMIQATMNFAAVTLGDGLRTRACYYRYEPGPPQRLCKRQYAGRADEPRREFVEGDGAADYIFRTFTGKRTILHPHDTVGDLPLIEHNAQYCTFISAPVSSGDTLFGMLSVDSTRFGDLTQQDKIFISIIAQILGSALAIGRRPRVPR